MNLELSPAVWALIALIFWAAGNMAILKLKKQGYDQAAEILRAALPFALAAFPRAPELPNFPGHSDPSDLQRRRDALEPAALRPPTSSFPPPLPVIVMCLALVGCAGLQELPRMVEKQAAILTQIRPALLEVKKVSLSACSEAQCRGEVEALFSAIADLYDISRALFCAHSAEVCQ